MLLEKLPTTSLCNRQRLRVGSERLQTPRFGEEQPPLLFFFNLTFTAAPHHLATGTLHPFQEIVLHSMHKIDSRHARSYQRNAGQDATRPHARRFIGCRLSAHQLNEFAPMPLIQPIRSHLTHQDLERLCYRNADPNTHPWRTISAGIQPDRRSNSRLLVSASSDHVEIAWEETFAHVTALLSAKLFLSNAGRRQRLVGRGW